MLRAIFKVLMWSVIAFAVLAGVAMIEPVRGKAIEVRSKWASPTELFVYGNWYQSGTHVKANPAKALTYIQMAADQEHALSQHRLGWYYGTEFLGEPDIAKAVTWYEKSAAQGLAKSHRNLASIYWGDAEIALDIKKAFEHDKKACDLGDVYSALRLGKLYQEGNDSVNVDHDLANTYLMEALKMGSGNAAYRMGNQLWKGHGVDVDMKAATAMYFIAYRLGQSRDAYAYAIQFQDKREEIPIVVWANAFIREDVCPTLKRKNLCRIKV